VSIHGRDPRKVTDELSQTRNVAPSKARGSLSGGCLPTTAVSTGRPRVRAAAVPPREADPRAGEGPPMSLEDPVAAVRGSQTSIKVQQAVPNRRYG
jgi:hypothetical protein